MENDPPSPQHMEFSICFVIFIFESFLREDFKKKSKKRDIVTIDPPTYPTPPNGDIKFSDIFPCILDPPNPAY